MGTLKIRAICILAVLLAAVTYVADQARADQLPSHLVGLTKSLLNDIDAEDFKGLDPKIAGRVNKILRQTRMRSWASTPAKIAADREELAAPLGLDLKNPRHLKALDAILTAENKQQRRDAFSRALQVTNDKVPGEAEIENVETLYNKVLHDKMGKKPTDATIEVDGDEGGLIKISWDPDTASFVTQVSFKDGTGDVYLHGSATAKATDDGLVFNVKADENPVTHIDAAKRQKLLTAIYGIWRDGEDVWIIRGPDDGQLSEPGLGADAEKADNASKQIQGLRNEIAELRKQKIHIWRDPGGGEVIQKKYKRLSEPFEYDREASRNYNAEKIKPLEQRIAEMEKTAFARPPIVASDPLGLNTPQNQSRNQQAIEIEIVKPSGYRVVFDSAQFDGKRITARRTLRDVQDIQELPDWVISSLVTKFSPPEWIELEVKFDLREKRIRLAGKLWRLHVTYNPELKSVSKIHTPYSKPLALEFDDNSVLLRVVGLDGQTLEKLQHNQPFRLEARFTRTRDGPVEATIPASETGQGSVILLPKQSDAGADDGRSYESGIFYARSKQYLTRAEPTGLFHKNRFFPESSLQQERNNWRRETEQSQADAKTHYGGLWSVVHSVRGALGTPQKDGFTGEALVAEDGKSAKMALSGKSGVLRYQSIEMRVQRLDGSPTKGILDVVFERVRDFSDPTASAGREPLPEGRILHLPTNLKQIEFTLEQASARTVIELRPAPDELIQVTLGEKRIQQLSGAWNSIKADGSFTGGGQETWVRKATIVGTKVVENQFKRSSPTKAFYPYGRNKDRGSSKQRTVFVWGKRLPIGSSDAVVIESGSPGVTYKRHVPAKQAYFDLKKIWKKAKVANPDDFDGMFVTFEFDKTVMPGPKLFTLNGVRSGWMLTFADAFGRLVFVDTPPEVGVPTEVFYSSDVGHLELVVETELPFKKPLIVELAQNDGKDEPRFLTLEKIKIDELGDSYNRTYRSKPLHFMRSDRENWLPPEEKGAIMLDTKATSGNNDDDTTSKFNARWPKGDLRLAVAPPNTARILDSPEKIGELWKQTLKRAAKCYPGISVKENESVHEISKFILTELKSRNINLRLGDHAAAILIASEFIKQAHAKRVDYDKKARSPLLLEEYLKTGRRTGGYGDAFWAAGTVKAFSTKFPPKELLDDRGGAFAYNTSELPREDVEKQRLTLLKAALFDYEKKVSASIAKAQKALKCKIEDLMVISGYRADDIVSAILPRLVVRRNSENGRTFFEPDNVARTYVISLQVKGAGVRALEKYAALDDTYKALALAAVGGAAFAVSKVGYLGAAAYATMAADAADVAYFGVKGVLDYQKGEKQYEYAKGAASVLGEPLLTEAEAERKSLAGAVAGVALPGLAALSSAARVRHLAKINKGKKIARTMGRVDDAALAKLSKQARENLEAYIDTIKETQALAKNTGFKAAANRFFNSTGRKLDEADTAFVKSFDDHAAATAASVGRGAKIASRIDDVEPGKLSDLSGKQKEDLAAFVKDIRARQGALANKEITTGLRAVGRNEARFARQYDEALETANSASKGTGRNGDLQKVANLQEPARPSVIDEVFPDSSASAGQKSNSVTPRVTKDPPASVDNSPARVKTAEAPTTTKPSVTVARDPPVKPVTRRTDPSKTVTPAPPRTNTKGATKTETARSGPARTTAVTPSRSDTKAATKPDASPSSPKATPAAGDGPSTAPRKVTPSTANPPTREVRAATGDAPVSPGRPPDSTPAAGTPPSPRAEPKVAMKSPELQTPPAHQKVPGRPEPEWRRKAAETPEDRMRALDPDGLTFAERKAVEKLDRVLKKFADNPNKTAAELADQRTALGARTSVLERGPAYKKATKLRDRQIAAPDYDLPPDVAMKAGPQRTATFGETPRRQLVEGDKEYLGQIMKGSDIHPKQDKVWAARVNYYVQEILKTGKMPPSVKNGKPIILQKMADGTDHVVVDGHHRIIAGQIASRLTGRPLLPTQQLSVPGSPRSIIPADQVVFAKAGDTVEVDAGRIALTSEAVPGNWNKIGVVSGHQAADNAKSTRAANASNADLPGSSPIPRSSERPSSSLQPATGDRGSPPESPPSSPRIDTNRPSDPGTPKVAIEIPETPRPASTPQVVVPHTIDPVLPKVAVRIPDTPLPRATPQVVVPHTIDPVPSRVGLDPPGSSSPRSADPFDGPISSRLLNRSLPAKPGEGLPAGAAPPYVPDAIIPIKTPNGMAAVRQNKAVGGVDNWQTESMDKPFAKGGFASADPVVNPLTRKADTGLLKKSYTENTGKYGKDGSHFDPENPLTVKSQQKMVEDTIYGASRLKDAGILQAEIVDHGLSKAGGWVIQRQIGRNLPDDVKAEQVLYNRLREGRLTPGESDAVADLFKKLDDAGLAWEDPNRGNIFLRTYKDGRVEAGILDTDRIGLWSELDRRRDSVLLGFMRDTALNPVSRNIFSMRPGQSGNLFGSASEFNQKMRESKGYWSYDPETGFIGGHLDGYALRKHFPGLADGLPGNWSRRLNLPPPPSNPPGKQGLFLIVPTNTPRLALAGLNNRSLPVRLANTKQSYAIAA